MKSGWNRRKPNRSWIWLILGGALVTATVFGFIFFTPSKPQATEVVLTPFASPSLEKAEFQMETAEVLEPEQISEADAETDLPDFEQMTDGVDYASGEVLISFEGSIDDMTQAMTDKGAGSVTLVSDGVALVEAPTGETTQSFTEALAEENYAVSPNYTRGLEVTDTATIEAAFGAESYDPEMSRPNDTYSYLQWHLNTVGAYNAWDYTGGNYSAGAGVKVAVIDTGIYSAHPDLDGNIAHDAITYTSGGKTYTGTFPMSVVVDDNGVNTSEDDNGHGTHVAGIVAAEANNSSFVSGVAPGAKIYSIDVFGYHGGRFAAYSSDIIRAIDAAIAADVDVINLSLGGYGSPSAAEEAKINQAVAAGIVVVAAAGNSNTTAAHYPSDYANVIAVIASDYNNNKSSYSNYGSAKDIAAPGGGTVSAGTTQSYIWSTYIAPNRIIGMAGTSMAAPVVSGIVALMLSQDSSLSVSEVKTRLYSSALDVGATGYDIYTGYGIANVERAFTGGSDFVIQNGVLTEYRGKSETVTIPGIVTEIGDHAFSGNAYIKTVIMGNQVQSIGTLAFSNCINLSAVDFGGGLVRVGSQAFYGCVSLTDVTLPATTTDIAPDAFRDATSLSAIYIDEANSAYCAIDGVLYSSDASVLRLYPQGRGGNMFTVPQGVTTIAESAFYGSKNLLGIVLPDSLNTIGDRAFEQSGLTEVTLPANVTTLGKAPFIGSASLINFYVQGESPVFSTVDGLLYSADGQTLLAYPVGRSAAEFIVPDGTSGISQGAFEGAAHLTRIVLPDSVTELGTGAFEGASSLSDIQFGSGVTSLTDRVFAQTGFSSMTIPSTITRIGSEAFEGSGSMTRVTIENSMAEMDATAFIGTAPGFTIYCYRYSYAQSYAIANRYRYSLLTVGVADVTLGAIDSPVVFTTTGITLSAAAAAQEGHETDTIPEYRFYYKLSTSTRWTAASTAFSTKNTALFKPRAEGAYDFKVEVRNQGRTIIDDQDLVTGVMFYSGNTPATYAALTIEGEKNAFLSKETIPLMVSAADEDFSQPTEYQIQYSFDGKRWLTTREWAAYRPFTADAGSSLRIDYNLPNTSEKHYYLKVNVRTTGRKTADKTAVVELNAYTIMPLVQVALDTTGVTPVIQNGSNGVVLSARATENAEYAGGTAEYCFYYKAAGSTRWTAIGKWSTADSVIFKPRNEGTYTFRAEARALGRKKADVFAESSDLFTLYFGAYPMTAVNDLSPAKAAFTENPISLTFEAVENIAGDAMEYRVLYSTNGRSYRTLSGFDWQTLNHTDGLAAAEIALPISAADVKYFVKVEARSLGRVKADAFAVTQVTKYAIAPLETLNFTAAGSNAAKQLVSGGIILTAESGANARYRFFYRKQGTTIWTPLSTTFITQNTAKFVPGAEGDYEFMVKAVAAGRRGYDLQQEFSSAVTLFLSEANYIASLGETMDESLAEAEAAETIEAPAETAETDTPEAAETETAPAPEPSNAPEPASEPSDAPTAAPATETAQTPAITSLAFAQSLAISAVIGESVSAESIMAAEDVESRYGVETVDVKTEAIAQTVADGQTVIVQLSETACAVVTAVSLNENGGIATLTVMDLNGEAALGSATDILRAWYYRVPAEEPTAAPEPTPEPEAAPEETIEPEPEPETNEEPVPGATPAPETPEPQPSETPAASE